MQQAEAFGPPFQRVLVRTCLHDHGLQALVKRFIDAGQLRWSDPGSAWAWNIVSTAEYPTVLQLQTELDRIEDNDPARLGVQAIIAQDDIRESEYVQREVVEWARRYTFELGFAEAAAAYQTGDMDKAYGQMMRRIDEMNEMQLDIADRGWFFEDFDQRQMRRQIVAMGEDYFPIGIDRLDKVMNGGLHYGELEVPVAYSGIGKTFWCVQRGYVAARIRRKVLHFVLEGGRGKTEDRYESRFADTLYSHVRAGSIDSNAAYRLRQEYNALRKCMVIRGFADKSAWRITYDEILAEIRTLRKNFGWVPDIVIVDYGDLVWAEGDNERERQKTAFRQLKSLSERIEFRGHNGYAVCAPSQAIRPGKNDDEKPHWLRPRDVADCYEKVRVADAIPTLNRTNDEKALNLLRVLLGKYRDSEDGLRCIVTTDYQHGALTRPGWAEPVEMPHPEVFNR